MNLDGKPWALVLLVACADRPPPEGPLVPLGDAQALMKALTEPASNAVFAAGGTAPKDADGWQSVEWAAVALGESANLLLLPPRLVDEPIWHEQAGALRSAAAQARDAAKARNADALSTASDAAYATCEGCHARYLKQR
jgi:hypothetical protein